VSIVKSVKAPHNINTHVIVSTSGKFFSGMAMQSSPINNKRSQTIFLITNGEKKIPLRWRYSYHQTTTNFFKRLWQYTKFKSGLL
jgi:DNA mismatch repair protein MutH